jgi:hypothetical protein
VLICTIFCSEKEVPLIIPILFNVATLAAVASSMPDLWHDKSILKKFFVTGLLAANCSTLAVWLDRLYREGFDLLF